MEKKINRGVIRTGETDIIVEADDISVSDDTDRYSLKGWRKDEIGSI